MNKGTILKYLSIVFGVIIIATTLHTIPIILLGICAALYFVGTTIEKGKINF